MDKPEMYSRRRWLSGRTSENGSIFSRAGHIGGASHCSSLAPTIPYLLGYPSVPPSGARYTILLDMLVVSLTGGIASGKSTASKLLSSPPHSLPLIDLDLVAREVVEPNDASKTLAKLVKQFGDSILREDGTLDRPALGRMTFGRENEDKRKVLNKITHSAIRRRLAWRLFKYWMSGRSIVIIDTPLAVEAGLWRFCGEMVVVWCPHDTQLSRMLKRDGDKGLTEEDANHRLNSQLPLEKKLPYADVVLDNADGASESLEEQVRRVVQRWRKDHSTGLGRLRTLLQFVFPPVGIVMALWAVYARTTRVGRRKREAEEQGRRV